MERESPPTTLKLVDVVAQDYPNASKVEVSFPEQWEHVETIQSEVSPIYLAGFPIERAFPGRHHFAGLPPEINVNLVFYRLYKFFQPWPMPQVTLEWNADRRHGRVKDVQGVKVQLQPIGQAQAWFGADCGVLWECYFEEAQRIAGWPDRLADVWQSVEKDIDVPRLFTRPYEPTFQGDYKDYLGKLGYKLDSENSAWWNKSQSVFEEGVRKKRIKAQAK